MPEKSYAMATRQLLDKSRLFTRQPIRPTRILLDILFDPMSTGLSSGIRLDGYSTFTRHGWAALIFGSSYRLLMQS